MELITWRGTPGVGDFMWALNCAHLHTWRTKVPVTLEMHWNHDDDYNHHFEDPETIIERMQFCHRYYDRKDDVTVRHVLNSDGRYSDWEYFDDTELMADGSKRQVAKGHQKARFYFQSGTYDDTDGGNIPDNDWLFSDHAFREPIKKKIVFWRPTFNAETPRTWKRLFTNDDWCVIIDQLKEKGYDMVELSYRTPIREAMYHLSTASQVICYDGMWHYMAKNFCVPMVVISTEGVTKYHTDYAIRASHDREVKRNIWYWVDNDELMQKHTLLKANNYREYMREVRA